MQASDLTVIFVSYGRAALLERTLKSFVETNPGCDSILFDNHSKWPVLKVISRYFNRLGNVLICGENKGKPFAHNYGASICSTPYLLFCDSDLEFKPGWFEAMSSTYEAAEDWPLGGLSGFCYGYINNAAHKGVNIQIKQWPPGCAVMISRKVFEHCGPFDESILIRCVDSKYYRKLQGLKYQNAMMWPESAIDHTGQDQRTFTETGEPIYYD